MSDKLNITEIGRVAVPTAVDTGIVISTSDIEADHAALKAAGVDVDAEIARWGHPVPPMFRLRDPGGNSLTIVEPIGQPEAAA